MSTLTAPEQITDTALIEAFVKRGIFETQDFASFWSQFVGAITCELHRLPNTDQCNRAKTQLAMHWLRAFLCNFYEDSAETFYWKPGALRQSVYRAGMELGVQILPMYPYSPAPDPRALPASLWAGESAMPGVHIDLEKCRALVREFAAKFRAEYEAIPAAMPPNAPPWTYHSANGYFDGVDGYVLYSMIRRFRPRRIVEIGSGNSTYLAAQAAITNLRDYGGYDCEIIAIEPFPNLVLRAGFPGLTRLIPKMVQEVPLAQFDELDENDILFIDSSHMARTGSDVLYEFLEILPRLKKGVLVHVHDIFLPREYPRDWILNMNRYWTEQYLLQSFLAFNNAFEVLVPLAYLHSRAPEVLEESFAGFRRDGGWTPASFWMRKAK